MRQFTIRYKSKDVADIISVTAVIDGMPNTTLTETEWLNCQSLLTFMVGDIWSIYLDTSTTLVLKQQEAALQALTRMLGDNVYVFQWRS